MNGEHHTNSRLSSTKKLALTAFLLASAIILSFIEGMLPSMPYGIKMGLSNIAVMYALFFMNYKYAFTIAVLKSLFVFSTRGFVASLLSISGGLLSITVMLLLMLLFKNKTSYLMISITGAIFHNIGQLAAVSFLYTNIFIFAYFPVLIISGTIAGILTATLLRVILPAFKKLGLNNKQNKKQIRGSERK